MPKREAPPSIVPTPTIDDGSGYRRRPKCVLCGDQIRSGRCSMVTLAGDLEQLTRPAHRKCGDEYAVYRVAMGQ